MIGMKRTSPAIAVTLPNLAPGIIFSFLQIPSDPELNAANTPPIIRCLCLLVEVLVVSCCIVLQATTMIDFPALFDIMQHHILHQRRIYGIISSNGGREGRHRIPINQSEFYSRPYMFLWRTAILMVGMIFLFCGLYIVLWAKTIEGPNYVTLFYSPMSICTNLNRKKIASASKLGTKIIKINNIFLELLLGERI
ncbi:WAT1-related protein [Rhynchospora pubera]|uniref:WAT1-related protein n=1 Tax=Rhynchospora pubera TaxID=906938 RepID=A0AAV8GJA6_9POAL|nr:WAT1-related protein [Rhynchospora pubera]